MDYGWHFHHIMNAVAKGEEPASKLADYLDTIRVKYTNDDMKMFFTTNHDENSWNGTVFERMGDNHLPMFVLAATYQNGMPLIYGGQEAGLSKRLRFFDKDTISWERTDLIPFYTKTLALKKENEALWNGAFGGLQTIIKTDADDRILAYYRKKNNSTVVVYLNFSNQPWSGQLPAEFKGDFKNHYTGEQASHNISLEPHGFLVLVQ
jgi:glycosidase